MSKQSTVGGRVIAASGNLVTKLGDEAAAIRVEPITLSFALSDDQVGDKPFRADLLPDEFRITLFTGRIGTQPIMADIVVSGRDVEYCLSLYVHGQARQAFIAYTLSLARQ